MITKKETAEIKNIQLIEMRSIFHGLIRTLFTERESVILKIGQYFVERTNKIKIKSHVFLTHVTS